ncbi:LysM peptidoglycan-binding domain-containing protein [Clostridium estertheticum]|uniref:LysM peptidoglycan-binding domain-containing protein n=1 Tax=Clostridium estertheticum TaxID=238834 RepID=UPI0013E91DAA|nr:LysM peptidoglycan-binding domain-containing protein [Clostridium estertheticum]MBZ9684903.1 LysM peptidoglycan-binding domain-containing protein [Clostridium estertheticum]
MRMKKGIISVSTIVVVILGVFFALRFIGGSKTATNIKPTDDSIVQKSNEGLTNENEGSNLSTSETQQGIENTEGQSTNEMDVAYINDKTNVGIYTVKKDDTVFSIAKTYMPSQDKTKIVEFIKNRNSIDASYKISEGQKIVIPYEKTIETSKTVETDVNTSEYIIKKQDTLTSIAKVNMPTYAVKQAIEMIKETNKITDENNIKEGTHIYIPK